MFYNEIPNLGSSYYIALGIIPKSNFFEVPLLTKYLHINAGPLHLNLSDISAGSSWDFAWVMFLYSQVLERYFFKPSTNESRRNINSLSPQ